VWPLNPDGVGHLSTFIPSQGPRATFFGAELDRRSAAYNKQAQQLLDNIAKTQGADSAAYGYAQQLLGIGKIVVKPTKLDVDTAAADAKIAAFQKQLVGITNKNWVATVGLTVAQQSLGYASQIPGLVQALTGAHATGGLITGPGTGTSDSIPARLSNREYVTKASSVAKYGVAAMDAVNSGRATIGYASGGSSGSVQPMCSGCRRPTTCLPQPRQSQHQPLRRPLFRTSTRPQVPTRQRSLTQPPGASLCGHPRKGNVWPSEHLPSAA
jgi:hypothetical protein